MWWQKNISLLVGFLVGSFIHTPLNPWQVAPSVWRATSELIFGQTFHNIGWKNEQLLFCNQLSRATQKNFLFQYMPANLHCSANLANKSATQEGAFRERLGYAIYNKWGI